MIGVTYSALASLLFTSNLPLISFTYCPLDIPPTLISFTYFHRCDSDINWAVRHVVLKKYKILRSRL